MHVCLVKNHINITSTPVFLAYRTVLHVPERHSSISLFFGHAIRTVELFTISLFLS